MRSHLTVGREAPLSKKVQMTLQFINLTSVIESPPNHQPISSYISHLFPCTQYSFLFRGYCQPINIIQKQIIVEMDSRGTFKLFDGVYLGDESSARDEEHILLNRVAVIVNLTPLPNYFSHYGIEYPHIQWPPKNPQEIVEIITEAKQRGESVLIHGEQNLDFSVALAAVYLMERQQCEYEERFRWSLFKTLEFMSSRIEGLAFASDTFEILKKHEMAMLNQETRLTYNWELKPTDTEELVLRNTFRNANNKDKQKGRVSTPSKPKLKEKRRISWKIEPLQQVKLVRQLSKNKILDPVSKIRNQVLSSVRRILDREQSLKSAPSTSASDSSNVPLKKYKSSYSLACLPLKTPLKKMENIPIVSVQLTEMNEDKRTDSEISLKRAKTEGCESNSTSRVLPEVTITLKNQAKTRSFGHRRMSDSLKKLKNKDSENQLTNSEYNDLIYDKLR